MINRLLFFLCFLFAATAGARQMSIFDHLASAGARSPVSARLVVPMDSLAAKVTGKQIAHFSFTDAEGREFALQIKTSVRGRFRRMRCGTPPLKLDFDKKDLANLGLAEHDKYKLVLPCFEGADGEALVQKEYLAYQAYALLSPHSFRTQLLQLTLVDLAGKRANRVVTAFMIEDTDEMAARLGGEEVEKAMGLPASDFDADAEATHALLQYMLGNCDWSLQRAKNVKVVRLESGKLVPVGYDFDFSGWVGAPYASPSRETGQHSIYERVYLGYSQPDAVLQAVVDRMAEQRKAVVRLIDTSLLDQDRRVAIIRFTTRFFNETHRLRADGQLPLYDQLRGETAQIVPPGDRPELYGVMGR